MIRIQDTAGAKLEPLAYTFLDSAGAVIDLTGYSGSASWERDSDGATGTVAGVVSSLSGTVTVTLPSTVTDTAGVVDVMVWAGNGTFRLPGERWRILLAEPPGTPPSI